MYFKKNGFTLAETLITLGIIGVVAAITIPGLITEHQKRTTVTKLQRAISVLNQAYKLSFDELGEPTITDSTNMNSRQYFDTYWAPFIKILSYCDTASKCGYASYTPFTNTKGSSSSWYVVESNLRSTFMTMEGFVYVIFLATWQNAYNGEKKAVPLVLVDINGGAKPNKYGKDVFFLTRVEDDGGGIRTNCFGKTDAEIKQECSTTGTGECCAERIRRAGWKIEKDYPWK